MQSVFIDILNGVFVMSKMVNNETNSTIPDKCDPIWEVQSLIKLELISLDNYSDIRVLLGNNV